MTLGRRSFAAALLAPRPASVPSMASPKTPGGRAEGIVCVLIGLLVPVLARALGARGVAASAAAQPCGTDSVPTTLARPINAETGGAATATGLSETTGRTAPAMKGPMPWCSSRIALTASAWLVVWIATPENVELVVDAAALVSDGTSSAIESNVDGSSACAGCAATAGAGVVTVGAW